MLLATKAVIIMLFDRLVSIIRGVSKRSAVGVAVPIAMLHLATESQSGTSVKAVVCTVRAMWSAHHATSVYVLALCWTYC